MRVGPFPENCVSISATIKNKRILQKYDLIGENRQADSVNHNWFFDYSYDFLLGMVCVSEQKRVRKDWLDRVFAQKNKNN